MTLDKIRMQIAELGISYCWLRRILIAGILLVLTVVGGSLTTIAAVGVPALLEIKEQVGELKSLLSSNDKDHGRIESKIEEHIALTNRVVK